MSYTTTLFQGLGTLLLLSAILVFVRLLVLVCKSRPARGYYFIASVLVAAGLICVLVAEYFRGSRNTVILGVNALVWLANACVARWWMIRLRRQNRRTVASKLQ